MHKDKLSAANHNEYICMLAELHVLHVYSWEDRKGFSKGRLHLTLRTHHDVMAC